MAAVTAAVVGATVAVGSAVDQRNKAKDAAKGIEDSNIESVQILEQATREGDDDLVRARDQARISSTNGTNFAQWPLIGLEKAGERAFGQVESDILNDRDVSDMGGPMQNFINRGTMGAADPNLYNISDVVGGAVNQNAKNIYSGMTPAIRERLLGVGKEGLSINSDLSGIRTRGYEQLADIATGSAGQRATNMVGSQNELQQLASGANEARLLGDIASSNYTARGLEAISGAAGQIEGIRR